MVDSHHPDLDPGLALARLSAAKGWLRSEISTMIHRKRTPDLVFLWEAV